MTIKMKMTNAEADAVADGCADAYSAGGWASWRGVARLLRRRGYDAREAEAIMRSKHTRWARDHYNGCRRPVPVSALGRYLDDPLSGMNAAEVADLVRGTFDIKEADERRSARLKFTGAVQKAFEENEDFTWPELERLARKHGLKIEDL